MGFCIVTKTEKKNKAKRRRGDKSRKWGDKSRKWGDKSRKWGIRVGSEEQGIIQHTLRTYANLHSIDTTSIKKKDLLCPAAVQHLLNEKGKPITKNIVTMISSRRHGTHGTTSFRNVLLFILQVSQLSHAAASNRRISAVNRRNSDILEDSTTAKLFRNVEGKTANALLKKNGRGQFESFASGNEFRHELMLSCLDAILKHDKGARWLTLGDAWGREAIYVHKHGGHATASSLQDSAIKAAAKWGYIDDYATQNAERLTYEDDAFDYTFIKEAFHHLTRPYAGIYEMVRVARKAAVLFEPADNLLDSNLTGVNASLFHNVFMADFEPCGFQYRVNAFEMVKTAMALNLPAIAFRGWNDPYKDPLESTVEAEYRENLNHLNELGEAGKRPFNLLSTVFIKRRDPELVKKLRREKYYVMELRQFTDSSKCT